MADFWSTFVPSRRDALCMSIGAGWLLLFAFLVLTFG